MIQQCLKTLTIYSSPKLRGCYNEPYRALIGVSGMQVKFCWVFTVKADTQKTGNKAVFSKYIVELAPDFVLLYWQH